MVGAVSTNFHEGSRTEYLAQYIFASFGTAIPVPHQEDSGVDIYCTLTEKIGALSWARAYFTVQVKSNLDSWVFDNPESVRWLVEHPLPLFLCVIDKKAVRIRIYNTSPRFFVWSNPPLPSRMELVPNTEDSGLGAAWSDNNIFSLSPIIDASLQDLLEEEFYENTRNVLRYWIDIDLANLQRIKSGIEYYEMPYEYHANKKGGGGTVFLSTYRPERLETAKKKVKELVAYYGLQIFKKGDFAGATRCAMLLRYLFKDDDSGMTHDFSLHNEVNSRVVKGQPKYLFHGVDALNAGIERKLEPKKKISTKPKIKKAIAAKNPKPKQPKRRKSP